MMHILLTAQISHRTIFLTLKEKLRDRIFNTEAKVISAVQCSSNQLHEIGFSSCFQKCVERWDRCISSKGRYLKKE